jgi:hypothetical protein
MQRHRQALRFGLAFSTLVMASSVVRADEYVDKAKSYIASITAPGAAWTGPTTGPKAQGHKLVVFVNYDQRNSGGRAVGEFAGEAAKIMGWDYRVLDGQGTVSGQTAALNQAIALKPDGIALGSVDALPEITQAVGKRSCPAWRERRREVDADQDTGGRACARRRRDFLPRGGDFRRAASCRLHPSGPRSRRMDDGGREYLSRPRLSPPLGHHRLGRHARPGGTRLAAFRVRSSIRASGSMLTPNCYSRRMRRSS